MAEENAGHRLSQPINWPAEMTPFQRATCQSLLEIPNTWTLLEWSALTNSQEKGIKNLIRAGLVEAKIVIGIRVASETKTSSTEWRVAGDFLQIIQTHLRQHLTNLRLESGQKGRQRKKFSFWIERIGEVRATSHGELAQRDLAGHPPFENGTPWWVIQRVAGPTTEAGAPPGIPEVYFISVVSAPAVSGDRANQNPAIALESFDLAIIKVVTSSSVKMTITDIAGRPGCPKDEKTVRRIVTRLINEGYLSRPTRYGIVALPKAREVLPPKA
jgi:hypothetical protein